MRPKIRARTLRSETKDQADVQGREELPGLPRVDATVLQTLERFLQGFRCGPPAGDERPQLTDAIQVLDEVQQQEVEGEGPRDGARLLEGEGLRDLAEPPIGVHGSGSVETSSVLTESAREDEELRSDFVLEGLAQDVLDQGDVVPAGPRTLSHRTSAWGGRLKGFGLFPRKTTPRIGILK